MDSSGDGGFRWSARDNPDVKVKYEVYESVGSGAYSDVYRGRRKVDGRIVALKEVYEHKSSVRELTALRLLIGRQNVVQLLDYIWLGSGILLVLEYLPSSLEDVIEAQKQRMRRMPEAEMKKWIAQLLQGVAACHEACVFHRDIKPSNLLISEDGTLKVADFGQALVMVQGSLADGLQEFEEETGKKNERDEEIHRWLIGGGAAADVLECDDDGASAEGYGAAAAEKEEEEEEDDDDDGEYACNRSTEEGDAELTGWVGTRWYKSPEQLYGSRSYGVAVDLWAVGCVICEIIDGETLFAGTSDIDQLSRIVRVLGVPNEKCWPGVSKLPDYDKICFSDDRPPLTLKKYSACGLVEKLLVYSPSARITAADALKDPYFTSSLSSASSSSSSDDAQQRSREFQAAMDEWINRR